MKVFNVDSIKKNQRFNNALLYSIPLTIVLIIGYTIVRRLLPVEFSIIYIGFGYLIGMCIQKYGRGVTRQFSILGAVLAFLCFFFCDVFTIAGFNIIFYPELYYPVLVTTLNYWFNLNWNGILGLLFRLAGIYYAYNVSRII